MANEPPHHESHSTSLALEQLLTTDRTTLINTVDKLRNIGVSKYIQLPQIVVCGDQSSGKSSVLEAISHISFPCGEGLCTTFPTELALRRGSSRTVKVQLKPSCSRPESEKASLASHQSPISGLKDFEKLVIEAKEHLRRNAGHEQKANSFFEDTLHVEVTDPEWLPLSLVDLPGLISTPNSKQTTDDVSTVNNLVSKYMKDPRSIILAVIPASYELPLQKVFSFISKHDPQGKRTICVVTKPDSASFGTNDLPQFVKYAQNKLLGYQFELGWHIVMNRGHNAQDQTMDDRDKAENIFFAQADWSGKLHPNQLGIKKLRDRLSTLLERHTRAEMSGILMQLNKTLTESRGELSKLGPARDNIDSERVHLTTISQRFGDLVRQAVNGHYDDPSFFLSELPDSDPRKLRAALQNMNESFAKRMYERGHTKQIVNHNGEGWPDSKVLFPLLGTSISPEWVTRNVYIQYIMSLSRKSKGKELIGSPNLGLVRDLFLEQSRPWRALATKHLENVLQLINAHLAVVSDNVAPPKTAAILRREIIFDAVDGRHKRVMEKLEELLKPHEKGYPITYDMTYIESSRSLAKADVIARLEKYQHKLTNGGDDKIPHAIGSLQFHQIIGALKLESEDVEEVGCTKILNCMQAYYDGAIRTFVDNVAVLAVEGCLVDDLENVFSATIVARMNSHQLHALGGETDQARTERLELKQKVVALQDAQKDILRAGVIQERQMHDPPQASRSTQQRKIKMPSSTAYPTSKVSEQFEASSSTPIPTKTTSILEAATSTPPPIKTISILGTATSAPTTIKNINPSGAATSTSIPTKTIPIIGGYNPASTSTKTTSMLGAATSTPTPTKTTPIIRGYNPASTSTKTTSMLGAATSTPTPTKTAPMIGGYNPPSTPTKAAGTFGEGSSTFKPGQT